MMRRQWRLGVSLPALILAATGASIAASGASLAADAGTGLQSTTPEEAPLRLERDLHRRSCRHRQGPQRRVLCHVSRPHLRSQGFPGRRPDRLELPARELGFRHRAGCLVLQVEGRESAGGALRRRGESPAHPPRAGWMGGRQRALLRNGRPRSSARPGGDEPRRQRRGSAGQRGPQGRLELRCRSGRRHGMGCDRQFQHQGGRPLSVLQQARQPRRSDRGLRAREGGVPRHEGELL